MGADSVEVEQKRFTHSLGARTSRDDDSDDGSRPKPRDFAQKCKHNRCFFFFAFVSLSVYAQPPLWWQHMLFDV